LHAYTAVALSPATPPVAGKTTPPTLLLPVTTTMVPHPLPPSSAAMMMFSRRMLTTAPHTRAKPPAPTPSSGGFFDSTASETFTNRWLMVIPAFATHLCLGAPYAWSLMADVATREIGLVAPAAADWTLMETAFPLSLIFVFHGLGATLFGKWQLQVGPRVALAAASVAFGGGMILGAAGIHYHSLPLLYAGYGVMGGTGVGLGYTPPVQTLMQWFPDKVCDLFLKGGDIVTCCALADVPRVFPSPPPG